ncbi:MAG: DUF2180 family protein [Solirubrobacteraceae bacterium]
MAKRPSGGSPPRPPRPRSEAHKCYVCAERGTETPAVALCRSCQAGLCLEHLREAAERQRFNRSG